MPLVFFRAVVPNSGFRTGWPKTVRKPALEEFVLRLGGRRMEAVHRRAKYILVPLDTGATLILHLGMAGRLRLQPGSQPAHPLVHHVFFLDDGSELRFQDGRKFGKLWLAQDAMEVLPALGPEPLGEGFTAEALARALAGRIAPVKALLLEQSVAAGMGNLYADESLYLAGIHPLRPAAGLSLQEIARLRDAIVEALTSAGAQYDRSRAESWPDPPLALETWTIPRQLAAPCLRCGGSIEGIRVRARSTYFCPGCQE